MRPLIRLAVIFFLGAFVAAWMPRAGVLEASTRIIPFLSLLMAGILPAMMLTVSILKGDDLSVQAVDEYSAALRAQLRFWASLFASAATAAGFLILMVVFSKLARPIYSVAGIQFAREAVVTFWCMLFGGSLSLLISRLWPAYRGLESLMNFNTGVARAKAQKTTATSLARLTELESTKAA